MKREIEDVFRAESRRVLATLIRLLGDFDLAEEALQEAFAAALKRWPTVGIPANPRAWLVSAGRFKGIDTLRRGQKFVTGEFELPSFDADPFEDEGQVRDDSLRLVFTCCHPALGPEAQIALTLREVCGLSTEEIARAFLTSSTTIGQRLVRAKAKIRVTKISYEIPPVSELADRLASVLKVVYLVFNEGYSDVSRTDLCDEAIRLARLVVELLPEAEAQGLLALLLLQQSRRSARYHDGNTVLLEDQDRTLWQRNLIDEGLIWVGRALLGGPGAYGLQAAISAVHSRSLSFAETDWSEILRLYDGLLALEPSPVVALNRAVALSMRDGAEVGLAVVDALADGELADYPWAHAARADLQRRLGRRDQARVSYERALALTEPEPERRFLEQRLATL